MTQTVGGRTEDTGHNNCWFCLSSGRYTHLFALPGRYHFQGDQSLAICPTCLERQFPTITPVVTVRDGLATSEQLTTYAFATSLLPAVRSGEKTGTVRYGDQRDIGHQDIVGAVHSDTGDLVALLRIKGWAELPVRGVPLFFKAMRAEYPHQTPKAVSEALNTHYETSIGPKTPVRALAYERIAVAGWQSPLPHRNRD